ncbi:MAG: phage tail sheath subtilisin-like domain-containing protein, partial [Bacteroides sp.]
MGEYKTPGVYIKEKSAFGNSVVEAATAIPAFIGYTEKAVNGNDSLTNVPWRISSMTEFMQYFGGAPKLQFEVDIKKYHTDAAIDAESKAIKPAGAILKPEAQLFQMEVNTNETETLEGKPYKVSYAFCVGGKNPYTLYYNLLLFFANGGGACYIVSVGSYTDSPAKKPMTDALDKLTLEQEITMVVVPEAVKLSVDECKDVQQQMLSHCGYTMKNRFALFDIYPKEDKNTGIESQIGIFWNNIGSNFLSYGAAYFPWLNTSVLGNRDLNGTMFTYKDGVCRYRDKFAGIDAALPGIVLSFLIKENQTIAEGEINNEDEGGKSEIITEVPRTDAEIDKTAFHLALYNGSSLYKQALQSLLKVLNLLPPSSAMAGIYTRVDNSRGVWKAPANVALNYVESPTEEIDDDQQADLNAPMNGKAINVIRTFRGEGVKVWGARTLDGNSLDWRYINVRRTLLFLEESVKNAARAYVFEPNDAAT